MKLSSNYKKWWSVFLSSISIHLTPMLFTSHLGSWLALQICFCTVTSGKWPPTATLEWLIVCLKLIGTICPLNCKKFSIWWWSTCKNHFIIMDSGLLFWIWKHLPRLVESAEIIRNYEFISIIRHFSTFPQCLRAVVSYYMMFKTLTTDWENNKEFTA